MVGTICLRGRADEPFDLMNNADRIIELLAHQPELKASEIAARLGISRRDANRLLYNELCGKVRKDEAFRWSLTDSVEPALQSPEPTARSDSSMQVNGLGVATTRIESNPNPKPGDIVRVRTRAYLVEDVELAADNHVISAVCLDDRSEEDTSELQSPVQLVCRLLLEKKK